ncbi:hypothetical protein CDAR_427801, partial [Caerostris darwini]
YLF